MADSLPEKGRRLPMTTASSGWPDGVVEQDAESSDARPTSSPVPTQRLCRA
jgi:hypothetical protein